MQSTNLRPSQISVCCAILITILLLMKKIVSKILKDQFISFFSDPYDPRAELRNFEQLVLDIF